MTSSEAAKAFDHHHLTDYQTTQHETQPLQAAKKLG